MSQALSSRESLLTADSVRLDELRTQLSKQQADLAQREAAVEAAARVRVLSMAITR
jgi:hypothetical protein